MRFSLFSPRASLSALTFVALVLGCANTFAASFDCKPYIKSGKCPEVTICQNDDLSLADETMAALREQLRLYPGSPELLGMQAKGYAALGKRLLQHQTQAEVYLLQGSLPAAIEQLQLAQGAGDGNFYELSAVEARLKELRTRLAAEAKPPK